MIIQRIIKISLALFRKPEDTIKIHLYEMELTLSKDHYRPKSISSCKFHQIRSISQLRGLYASTWTSSTHLTRIDAIHSNIRVSRQRKHSSFSPAVIAITLLTRLLIKTCLNAGATPAIKTRKRRVTRSPTRTPLSKLITNRGEFQVLCAFVDTSCSIHNRILNV